MSVARHLWLGAVLSKRGPTAKARLVACGLFNHMDRYGTGASASVRTLADETGLSGTDVQRVLRQLDADGWVIRQEKGRGQYAKRIYMYEAMIPPVGPMCQPQVQSPDPPMCQPQAQSPDPPMYQPQACLQTQCANSPDPMCQPQAQIHSETSKNPDVCPSGTDPGFTKDRRNVDPKSIAATVLKNQRALLGMSADEVRRELKHSREVPDEPAR